MFALRFSPQHRLMQYISEWKNGRYERDAGVKQGFAVANKYERYRTRWAGILLFGESSRRAVRAYSAIDMLARRNMGY